MTFEEQVSGWFQGDEIATDFAMKIWHASQDWDDLEDEGSCRDHNAMIAWLAFEMPQHPFMQRFGSVMLPILQSMYVDWRTANVLERSGDRDDCNKAYMLRAAFYRVVHMMVCCLFGQEQAVATGPEIWRAYGETAAGLWRELQNG